MTYPYQRYKCDGCGKTFSHKSGYRSHLRRKHGLDINTSRHDPGIDFYGRR